MPNIVYDNDGSVNIVQGEYRVQSTQKLVR